MRTTALFLGLALLAACAPAEEEAATAPLSAPLGADDDDARDAESERRGDALARGRRIARLKARIRAIAEANIDRRDNLAAVKAQLQPLVAQLVALAPRLSEQEKLALSVGAWRNLWNDLGYGEFQPDLRRVHQIVTPRGHYWNLSQAPAPLPGVGPAISAIRGAYAIVPPGLAIRFTRDGVVPGTLVGRDAAGLVSLAADIERGAIPLTPLPGGGVGPLRISGTLRTVYADSELRIIDGDVAPVFDDDGVVSVPGQYGRLFVLVRLAGPVR